MKLVDTTNDDGSLFFHCPKATEQYTERSFQPTLTFFDGSKDVNSPTTSRPKSIKAEHWTSLSIAAGDLFVIDVTNPEHPYQGVSHPIPEYNPYECPPPFAMVPRHRVLLATGFENADKVDAVFNAGQTIQGLQPTSTNRHCKVLGDNVSSHKYAGCYGVVPKRLQPGTSLSAVMRNAPDDCKDILNNHARTMEQLFKLNAHPFAKRIYGATEII
jgi:hypothetical protein